MREEKRREGGALGRERVSRDRDDGRFMCSHDDLWTILSYLAIISRDWVPLELSMV